MPKPKNNEYPNCHICHQEPTTKSRTLSELYRCKRKAKGEIGGRQMRVQTTAVSRNRSSTAQLKAIKKCNAEAKEQ